MPSDQVGLISFGRVLNDPFAKEPWTQITFVRSVGTLFFRAS